MRSISIILIAFLFAFTAGCGNRKLRPEYVVVQSAEDIRNISDFNEIPLILYDNEFNFSSLRPEVKKKLFIDLMLPSILAVKFNLEQQFRQADQIVRRVHQEGFADGQDSVFMEIYMDKYGADNWWDVRRRLKPHPVSIVLAQAAVESGWGSSRFFRRANNVFGIWSYDRDEERIPSQTGRAGRTVYLRAYPNIAASIEDYYGVIARARAYRRFRAERTRSSDPLELIKYLRSYSELRGAYVQKLRVIIDQNQLWQYDSAGLAPDYTKGRTSLYF